MRSAMMRYGWALPGLACGLALLIGCGKSGSSGSEGTVGGGGAASTSDTVTVIEQKIKADKDLTGADIKVSQQNGTIELDGTVSAVTQKDKAEQIVQQTQQEKHQQTGVLDNLTVKEGTGSGGGSGGGQ